MDFAEFLNFFESLFESFMAFGVKVIEVFNMRLSTLLMYVVEALPLGPFQNVLEDLLGWLLDSFLDIPLYQFILSVGLVFILAYNLLTWFTNIIN